MCQVNMNLSRLSRARMSSQEVWVLFSMADAFTSDDMVPAPALALEAGDTKRARKVTMDAAQAMSAAGEAAVREAREAAAAAKAQARATKATFEAELSQAGAAPVFDDAPALAAASHRAADTGGEEDGDGSPKSTISAALGDLIQKHYPDIPVDSQEDRKSVV